MTALLFVLVASTWPSSAAIVREPYLQQLTPDSVTIVWRTDGGPTDSRVQFGTDELNLNQTATATAVTPASNSGVLDHIVPISGLTAGTRYYYNIGTTSGGVDGGGTSNHYFETAPTPGSALPVLIWAFGDSGNNGTQQKNVRDAMLTATAGDPPDLFVHLGDIAYDSGTDTEFTNNHFGVYENIQIYTPIWPSVGNHEVGASDSPTQSGPYYEAFVLPTAGEAGGLATGTEAYYSFDYANIHFIALDSADTDLSPGSAMLTWLAADLAATTREWIVAFWHHPPYSKGSHNSDNAGDSGGRMVAMRENVLPILEAGGVDLVLTGHSHTYERSYLIDQVYGFGSSPNYVTPDFPTLAGLTSPVRILDAGDGDPTGDGAYVKSTGLVANDGAVYVVAGHGGRASGSGSIDHPVKYFSEKIDGSLLITIHGSTLSQQNLRWDDVVSDSFSLVKLVADGPGAVDESFDGFTATTNVGSDASWYDGGSGPVVTTGAGVNGSNGLAQSGSIFIWADQPFDWNAADFLGIVLQGDFQANASGAFDDDRVGWMTTNSSTSSNNIFGIQLDPGGSGATGNNIECYWDGDTVGDDGGRTSIVALPPLTAGTFYRLRAEIYRLSATSARIDVSLTELDGAGNPLAVVASGTIGDTDLLPNTAGNEIPAARYFTGPIWPAFKNHNGTTGYFDNAHYELLTGTAPPECTLDPDCDDSDLCTTDTCVAGVCDNAPVVCGTGDVCNPVDGLCAAQVLEWEAYNDLNAYGPNGDANAANVTEHNYTVSGGALLNYANGAPLTITVTGSTLNGYDPQNSGGPAASSTDVDDTFGGIVDLLGTDELDAADWDSVITFENLDPAKVYTITLTANRHNTLYADARYARVTIEGADTYVNASSTGVVVNGDDSVSFSIGYNTVYGYVAKWTNVTAADGTFSVKSEWDTGRGSGSNNTKGYAMSAFKLEQYGTSVPVCGNGLTEAGEDCDDGNLVTGDGCDENCIDEICGNGVLQSGEQCDDGNLIVGDGCDASCNLEGPAPPFQAYNDCVYDPSLAGTATDPNGQSVHYKATNVTTYGIGTNFTGSTSGELVDLASGNPTGVTAALTESGGVVWQPDVSTNWYGGYDPALGTDARNTFGGIADMTGVIYYGSSGWWVDLTISGLDPAKSYTFATSATRCNPIYNRLSIYTLSGADTLTNASTAGTDELASNQVRFNTGDNCSAGYVARWTGITAADGTFTVRAEADPASDDGYKAYAFDVFMLEEEDGTGGPVCGNGAVESGEECDDGNLATGDGCDENCVNEVCGNGVVQTGEQCDDGNTASGDGCDASCQDEYCGDGTVQPGLGEQCEADVDCAAGEICVGCACELVPVCGNGAVESGEECDDGNLVAGDGCDASCVLETPASGLICETFDTGFTLGAELRTHPDWFYEPAASGPMPQAAIGVNGSVGLTDGERAFTWVAHPFDWNAPDFIGVTFQMDYQTSATGALDDDRLGWTISDTDDSSDNIFGVQMDPGGGGAGGNIEAYWDGDTFGDNGGRTSIVDLPALSGSSWYRLRATFTKLTATSARIDVWLFALDGAGNEVGTVVSGTLADTDAVPGTANNEVPNLAYFTAATIWPVYKNFTAVAGAVDNTCFGLAELGATTVDHVLVVSVDGLRPDAFTSIPAGSIPNLTELASGVFTGNARTTATHTDTLPNHTSILTSRPVFGENGHEYDDNGDPAPGVTLHTNLGAYVAGMFDVAHDYGLRTALFAAKTKFSLFDASWNGTTGAPDTTGADDGPDKIDTFLIEATAGNRSTLTNGAITELTNAAADSSLIFLHYRDPDSAGHASGWDSAAYDQSVIDVDQELGQIMAAIRANPDLNGRTAIVLTTDHGGIGTGHGGATDPENYTIPFLVWFCDDQPPSDLYALNPLSRTNPGTTQPGEVPAPDQPVRNGDAGNVALDLLGLTPIPISSINDEQDLVTFVGSIPCGEPQTCEFDSDCDDGNPCNGDETCDPGTLACLPGTPMVCPAGESCNPSNGECEVDPLMAMFQQGVGGYDGTLDTFIQQNPGDTGNDNGALDYFGWDDDDPNGTGNDAMALLRFAGIFGSGPGQIPPGSLIVAAQLTYTVGGGPGGPEGDSGELHELLVGWTDSVGWDSLGGDSGATAGDEYDPAVVASASAAATGTYTINVTGSVQSWSDDPSTNRGWIVTPTGTNGTDLRSSEYAGNPAQRPKLTVSYIPPGPCLTNGDCDDGVACTDDVCNAGVCENTSLCPEGESCDVATGLCISGRVYCDDFDRAGPDLGPDWVVDNLTIGIADNQAQESGPFTYQPAQAHWVGGSAAGATDTLDQFAKLRVMTASPHPFGFMFHVNAADREHYEVHVRPDIPDWRWERYDAATGMWDGTLATCAAESLSDGDYIGATVEGTGPATVVSVWRWDTEPGTDVSIWGPPDCVMTAGSGDFVDAGNLLGIRAYAASTVNHLGDDWCGGDVLGGPPAPICGNGAAEPGEQCDDGNLTTGDGCDENCIVEECGNGVVQAGEECEADGDCAAGDVCVGCACELVPVCGNGVEEPGEQCDDGNLVNGDGCDENCNLEIPAQPFQAFNDCVYDPSLAGTATDPNGQSVHYIAPNVTTYGIGSGFGGSTSGELVDQTTGSPTGVTAALTESGGVNWQPDVSTNWYGGYDPLAGTDARNTFGGIADMTGVIYYGSSGWWVDLTISGLDPAKSYTFATSATRCNPIYNRLSIYTLSGADTLTNASTAGTDELAPNQVRFNTGDNCSAGYVARWTGITAADGTFTVRAEADPASDDGYKAYAFDVFMLEEEDGTGGPVCGNGAVESGEECDDGNTISEDGCSATCQDEFCGDGTQQVGLGEQCDDGNLTTGDGCDENCIVEECGNGVVQAGEECEADGDCAAGDVCVGCACELVPVCGNGVEEPGEACDDGNLVNGDGCDEFCQLEGAPGQLFCDDFNRPGPGLGPDWVVDNLTIGIAGDQVQESGPFVYQPAQAHWVAGATDTLDQFAKLGVVDASPIPFGFMFRVNGTDREHYEVHLRPDLPEWRWERYDAATGMWDGNLASCAAESLSDGDFIGATVEGTGPATTVSVWRWDTEPGSDVTTWGPPDCVMSAGSGDSVDAGNLLGIRAYGASTKNHAADDWCGGDVGAGLPLPVCGNGLTESGEECDDGNTTDGDGCDSSCQNEFCGDGTVQAGLGEQCDDGNTTSGDGCDAACQDEFCSDGTVQTGLGEQCDDGNLVIGDGCDENCILEACGNGVVQAGEECEADVDCAAGEVCVGCACELVPVCGNGAVESGEECDDGNLATGDGCDENCILEACGNGVLQSGVGEECDDGNLATGDGCDENCIVEECGNGVVQAGEECEADVDCAAGEVCVGCACELVPVCGNGVEEPGEECDDGNLASGDGCDEFCQLEGAPGQLYCDDFDRLGPGLGPDWVVDNLSIGISGDQVEENGPFVYQPAQAHWVGGANGGANGGATDSLDQFAKLGVVDASPHPFGFMFRVNGTDREHYEVHVRPDLPEWRWERYDAVTGLWDGNLASCPAESLSNGNFIGATVEGTGPATTVSVWRWDTDPGTDLSTWGPPDCVMSAGSGDFVDAGNLLGIRAYGASTKNHSADDWCGGDVSAGSGP